MTKADNEYHCSDEKEWSGDDIRLGVLNGKGYPLRYLEPGERYALAGLPEVTGVVVSHGNMGTQIRSGAGVKVKQIKNVEGDVIAEFTGKASVDCHLLRVDDSSPSSPVRLIYHPQRGAGWMPDYL